MSTSRRLRILLVLDRFDLIGGSERYAIEVARVLAERGHALAVMCGARGAAHATDPTVFAIDGISGPGLARPLRARVRACVRAFAPDVVYVVSLREPALLRVLLELAPVVRAVQDHTTFCPGLNKLHADGHACTRPLGVACLQRYWLDTGCDGFRAQGGRRALLEPLHRLGARLRDLETHGRCRALVVASRYMRDELVAAGVQRERIHVVPYFTQAASNVVDDERVEAAGPPTILCPARLVLPDKGVDYLLSALGKVRGAHRCVIAGDGPARAWLERKAHDEGLAARVSFVGWRSPRELDLAYRASSVVAFPSVWDEPFGLVGLEAMAHARPVVAFDVGGVREWLVQDVTGIAVARRDTSAFAAALDRLLADDALRARMGREGRARVAASFTPSAHALQLERLFEAACD